MITHRLWATSRQCVIAAFPCECTPTGSSLLAGGDLGARCWTYTRGGLCLAGDLLTQCCTSSGPYGKSKYQGILYPLVYPHLK